ncbi:hypothetical protein H8B13_09980 [Hymenobacter sp. BT188]|uniref:hypothetical protein n=1 Tax=Hymenobacter sp. BT188 TaxID=2763504 RepID=UPI0016513BB0|nr:hypothetical protein [Hymenobacter sp. BT188]MBC6607147.1 hypothetical protein [Hymenobacter sp. BT188]
MLLLFELFSITIITVIVCYCIGFSVFKILNITPLEYFFSLFLSLVIGLSCIVSVYALLCTHGSTVHALMIPLLFLMGYGIRKRNTVSDHLFIKYDRSSFFSKELLMLLVLSAGVVLVQYSLLYDLESEYLQTPFQDYVYYSRLTLSLSYLGVETNALEVMYPQFVTEQPYHYMELWLNSLLVSITKLPSVWVYFVSSSAVFITIICAGFMAIFAHFKIKYIYIFILSFLFLFVTGMRWLFLQDYLFVQNGALLSSLILCLNPKLAPIYVFLLLTALLLLNRYYLLVGFALALLPIVYISTTPVAGFALVSLVAYLSLSKKVTMTESFYMLLPMAVVCVYIILFYTLQPESYQFPDTGRNFALKSIIPELKEIKTLINITLGVFVNYSIYFGVYGLLFSLIWLFRRTKQGFSKVIVPETIWVWFGACLFMAAAMRAFSTHYLDSFQFFSNTIVPLTPVVLAILFAYILQQASKQIYAIIITSLILLIVVNFSAVGTGNTRYSPAFMHQVEKVAPYIGSRGGYVLADEDYENAYMLSSDSYTTGNYISNFKNNYAFMSLSALDPDSLITDSRFQRDSAQAEQIIRKSTFYRFAKFQALHNSNLSLDSTKYKFIIHSNIGFICVSKRAKLPLILKSLVDTSYTDSLSGEKLFVLKK